MTKPRALIPSDKLNVIEIVDKPERDKPKVSGQGAASKSKDTAGKPPRKKASAGRSHGKLLEDRIALDFADKHKDTFRYIALWNRWMKWDGDCWRHEDTLRAFDMSRKLCREAGDAKARTVAAVVTLARADREIAATDEQWDVGTEIFNTAAVKESR
jgi:putative DNA primase/helicase